MGSKNNALTVSTSGQSFDGKLDDARHYKRALSDNEITQVYGEGDTNRVYLADALGSIVALTDSSGVISNEYDYEPFGLTTTTGAGNKNSYKFTAREDDGTGLYFYRARYYHPVLGRFVSEDPIRYAGGDVNFYAYVGNDPTTYNDPTGLFHPCVTGPIVVTGTGAAAGGATAGTALVMGLFALTPDGSRGEMAGRTAAENDAFYRSIHRYELCRGAGRGEWCIKTSEMTQKPCGKPGDPDYLPGMKICIYTCPTLGVVRRTFPEGTQCDRIIWQPFP